MTPRCQRTEDLQLHPLRGPGREPGDAEVLCAACRIAHAAGTASGAARTAITDIVRALAIIKAGGHCECERDHCH